MVYPNNDNGSKIILKELQRVRGQENFRLFPSLRFEYFLTLLKNAEFIIGNSSAGVREAPYYGCLLYTSPSPRDAHESRMPSSA